MPRRSAAVAFASPCKPAHDALLAPDAYCTRSPIYQAQAPERDSRQGALGDRTRSTASQSSKRISLELLMISSVVSKGLA